MDRLNYLEPILINFENFSLTDTGTDFGNKLHTNTNFYFEKKQHTDPIPIFYILSFITDTNLN